MSLLQSAVICVLCCRVSSSSVEALLRRIQGEIGVATVCILGDGTAFFDNFTGFGLDVPTIVLTSGEAAGQSLTSEFAHNCIVVVPVFSDHQQNYKAILPRFQSQLRVRKFVVVVASHFGDFYVPFTYFHGHRFSRIFGTVGGNCYAYLPYALAGQIRQIPDDGQLPHAFSNLNGESIRSDIVANFPRAFWFPERDGYHRLGGPYGHVMDELLRKCNGTLREVNIGTLSTRGKSLAEVEQALKTDKIDISFRVDGPLDSLGSSYPLKFQQWTVLVPISGFIRPVELFTRPFTTETWTAIGIAFLMLVLLDYAKDKWVRVRRNFWNSFSRMLLIIIGRSPLAPVTSAYRFYALVLVFAFILNTFYLILFTHFLTVSIRRKQYNTLQDLIDNDVRILVQEEDRKFVELLNHSRALEAIITYVDAAAFYKLRESMTNTSYPFASGADYANLLIRMQNVYTESLFQQTRDGLSNYCQGFLMAEYSPFKDIIDRIVFQVIDSGLLVKWDRKVVREAIKSSHKLKSTSVNRRRRGPGSPIPLNLEDLSFAWSCLAIGWTVSLIVFVAEVGVRVRILRKRKRAHP